MFICKFVIQALNESKRLKKSYYHKYLMFRIHFAGIVGAYFVKYQKIMSWSPLNNLVFLKTRLRSFAVQMSVRYYMTYAKNIL